MKVSDLVDAVLKNGTRSSKQSVLTTPAAALPLFKIHILG